MLSCKIATLPLWAAAASLVFTMPAAHAFFDGQTGVVTAQIKAACPAFGSGKYVLGETSSPHGNRPIIDVFEHESGARCLCSRSKTEKEVRCGPTGAAPSKTARPQP
jgi:hypothetical protein